jgi:hypothetical protein
MFRPDKRIPNEGESGNQWRLVIPEIEEIQLIKIPTGSNLFVCSI